MTVEEIQEFITAFGKTAKLLKDAGGTVWRSMRYMKAIYWISLL